MDETKVSCRFFCEGQLSNRKKLFKEALLHAKAGKVVYISKEELNELPQLSQDIVCEMNSHHWKMISFLYASTLEALLESLVTLPEWQNIPLSIILEDLSEYCDKSDIHNACGVISFLIDTAICCSKQLRNHCSLYISINVDIVGEDYCNLMQEFYEATYDSTYTL